jgi:UDP-N-acetylglucosamine:LPS N-acetylglucosamine transferase
VLGRCGYSTVMDLAALRRPSILVPTPGQTEQEYLAAHLSANGFAFCTSQKEFDLQKAMNAASHYRYQLPQQTGSAALEAAIDDLFARISQ